MEIRILELAVDLTKSAMVPTATPWLNAPEKITMFLEGVAKKLNELKTHA
jgi:hypothetical protein